MAERNMEFPSNSQNPLAGPGPKKKAEPKNIQKVVTGEVVMKPVSLGKRIKGLFFAGDAKSAVGFVFKDVVVPAIRHMMADAGRGAIDRMVLGTDSTRRPRPGGYSYLPRTNYSRSIDSSPAILPKQPPRYSQTNSNRETLGDIILQTRDEAEGVIDTISELIENYEVASVADLHEMLGLPSTAIDNKWGWTSPRGAGVSQTRQGYVLVLPPLEEI